jgi:hypothetical protein
MSMRDQTWGARVVVSHRFARRGRPALVEKPVAGTPWIPPRCVTLWTPTPCRWYNDGNLIIQDRPLTPVFACKVELDSIGWKFSSEALVMTPPHLATRNCSFLHWLWLPELNSTNYILNSKPLEVAISGQYRTTLCDVWRVPMHIYCNKGRLNGIRSFNFQVTGVQLHLHVYIGTNKEKHNLVHTIYRSLDRESNPRPLAYGNTASIEGTTTLNTKQNTLL